MRKLLIISILAFASPLFAHPDGTYTIDGDEAVTVTFEFIGRCPDVPGALPGGLRTLSFSDAAELEPYLFVGGNYVEIHEGRQEIYVLTDDQCVPFEERVEIPASRRTFAGFSLARQR